MVITEANAPMLFDAAAKGNLDRFNAEASLLFDELFVTDEELTFLSAEEVREHEEMGLSSSCRYTFGMFQGMLFWAGTLGEADCYVAVAC